MSKKSEFKNDLEKIVKIFFLTKESFLVLEELYKTSINSETINNTINKGTFFTLTKVNYWRVIVLQLSKLFSQKERFSLEKFLEKCKKGNYFESLKIDQNFLESQLLEICQKRLIIDEIKIQRDKIFAHEDSNNNQIINDITLHETKELIELCQNIIFQIYQKVYNTHYDFNMGNSALSNLKHILKCLEEQKNQRKEDRKNLLKLLSKKI